METIKLYYEFPYMDSFKEVIGECIKREDGAYDVVMEKTAFFPEEGGQSPDRGTIESLPVLDVQIKNGIIYHKVPEYIEPGTEAFCRLDWDHRFSNMQQHSGEHLFSGTAHALYGCENVGFHLSDTEVTLDLDKPLTPEQILTIEKKVNEAIFKNIESMVLYPSKEEAESMEYRSKKEIDGQLRLVVYPGVDVCACCAPHVKKTGEIGILKVVSFMNNKGGVRINILCGDRALKDYEEKRKVLDDAGRLLSANQGNLVSIVEQLLKEKSDLAYELTGLKRKEFLDKLAEIKDGSSDVVIFTEKKEDDLIRLGLNDLMDRCSGISAVFSGDPGEYRYFIGSRDTDVKPLQQKLKDRFSAKGGGSSLMIQGKVNASREELEDFFK